MSEVSLQHIEKVYPHSEKKKSNLKVTDEGVLAVQDFNLNISDREFKLCPISPHDGAGQYGISTETPQVT